MARYSYTANFVTLINFIKIFYFGRLWGRLINTADKLRCKIRTTKYDYCFKRRALSLHAITDIRKSFCFYYSLEPKTDNSTIVMKQQVGHPFRLFYVNTYSPQNVYLAWKIHYCMVGSYSPVESFSLSDHIYRVEGKNYCFIIIITFLKLWYDFELFSSSWSLVDKSTLSIL